MLLEPMSKSIQSHPVIFAISIAFKSPYKDCKEKIERPIFLSIIKPPEESDFKHIKKVKLICLHYSTHRKTCQLNFSITNLNRHKQNSISMLRILNGNKIADTNFIPYRQHYIYKLLSISLPRGGRCHAKRDGRSMGLLNSAC